MRGAAAVVGVWLLASAAAGAQDMPLSQVLIDGEGWRLAVDDVRESLGLGRRSAAGPYAVTPTGGLVRKAAAGSLPLREGEAYNAVAVSPDGGTLVATAPHGRHVYAFRIDKDGGLSAREGYYALRVRRGQKSLAAGGLTFDRDRRLYVAAATGVQVFDPTGRLCGELLPPEPGQKVKDVVFGGKDRAELFVLSESGKVFSRKVKSKGVAPAKEK